MVGQRMKTNDDNTNPSERGLALSRREIWITLLLYPGHTLPTAAAPVVVAVGLALRDHVFAALPTVLAFLGSWLIHIAGVLTDNLELLRRHPAVSEHPELQDAIERHTLTLRGLEMAIVACVVAAVLAGLYLVLLGGDLVLALGIVGLVAGLAYAGGPLPYARSGMAEPIFFIMFGIVAEAGTYYIQTAATHGAPSGWVSSLRMVPWDVFVAGLPIGALITNVLIIDDIRDHAFDAAKGWRTGTVRFGVGWSRVRYLVLTAGAYLAPIFFWCGLGYNAWILLPLLTLPSAWTIARMVCTHERTADLVAMTPRASRLSLSFAVLLAIGLAVGGR